MSDYFTPRLDSFLLDLLAEPGISDQIDKAIVRHEYPYRNGADLQDLGAKTRTVRFTAIWEGVDYPTHYDFLTHLESTALNTLTHPTYGEMTGSVESLSIRRRDEEMYVEIDITFVEDLASQEAIATPWSDIVPAIEAAYTTSCTEQQAAVVTSLTATLGPEGALLAGATIDPTLPLASQFSSLSAGARAYLRVLDSAIATFEGTLLDIANPATTLISTLTFAANIPGRVIGSLTATIERISLAQESLRAFPSRFMDALDFELNALGNAVAAAIDPPGSSQGAITGGSGRSAAIAALPQFVASASAARCGLDGADLYAADQQQRDASAGNDALPAFDTLGRFLNPPAPEPVMTAPELEAALALLRTRFQAVLDSDRSQQALRAMALALLDHVSTAKNGREQLVTITVDQPTPLLLILHHHNLPVAMAERVLTLNPQIIDPNAVEGEVVIYVTG